ncbi:MAG: DinB family protein [Geminicoccaceae bacterium]
MEIRSIDPFLRYFSGIRERTQRVVQAIPEPRLEWAPAPGRFTLGDIVRHLATTERWMFAENVAGRPSRYPGYGRELADGYDAVLDYFERLHAQAMAIFANLSDADLARHCTTPAGTSIMTWKWLRAMVEHEVHHRGQLYLMLGMLEVPTPPLYGLSEPEVRARSLPPPEPGPRAGGA